MRELSLSIVRASILGGGRGSARAALYLSSVLFLAAVLSLRNAPGRVEPSVTLTGGAKIGFKRGLNASWGRLEGRLTRKSGVAAPLCHRSPYMNVAITIQDDVTGRLAKLESQLGDATDFRADIGRRLANDLREHFRGRQLNGPRNKFGAPSGGLWGEIRDSVNDGEVVSDGVTVTIADPRFNQKYFGGTITADDKLLAIPARSEAYGKSPRLFSNLKAIFFRSGAIALVQETPSTPRARGEKRIGTKREEGMVYYWLVGSVTQQKDPDALPSEAALLAGILDTGEKHLARIVREAAEGTNSKTA